MCNDSGYLEKVLRLFVSTKVRGVNLTLDAGIGFHD